MASPGALNLEEEIKEVKEKINKAEKKIENAEKKIEKKEGEIEEAKKKPGYTNDPEYKRATDDLAREKDNLAREKDNLAREKDNLLELRKEKNLLLSQGAAGPGPSSAAAGVPPSKKVRIDVRPSEMQPEKVNSTGLIPDGCTVRPNVAFFTGRQVAAQRSMVPPALLCVPEFGLVADAAFAAEYAPSCAKHLQAATSLMKGMAQVFPTEKERQMSFVKWFHGSFKLGKLLTIPQSSSSSTSVSTKVANDGHMIIAAGGREFTLLVLEVKNEVGSSGDPCFQLLRYYQQLHGDGQRWDSDAVVRATGAPVLCLELVGPNLLVSGAYTLEGNVVAREPLTPLLQLLPLGDRQQAHWVLLARVLAALDMALCLLERRLRIMVGNLEASSAELPCDYRQPDIMSPGALGALQGALQAATLTGSDRDQAAAGSGLRPSGDAWSRLPYPLMSGFSGVVALRGKAAFTCTQVETGRRVFIKFTQRAYPVEVHYALAAQGLTPPLFEASRLPGGWWMVVQEFLDLPWCTFDTISADAERKAALEAVHRAVEAMHAVQTGPAGEQGLVVHGDVRPCNVMLRKDGEAGAWRAQLVDLDWAGPAGRSRYPPDMAPHDVIPWHVHARPLAVMQQEHDTHALMHMF